MNRKAGAQISKRAFLQSLIILFVLMMLAGLLTRIVPAGQYDRIEVNGIETIDPTSFQYVPSPDYPVWRWFTAPIEVLWGPDALTIIVIIVTIFLIGGSFAILDKSGLMKAALARVVKAFAGRKYQLLLVIAFIFMAIGAFFGIFEEVVLLVPVMIALSYSLGWDALTGLGMSILATNMGFSAAVTNPFTIGVSQNIAGLPLYSGAWLRIPIFLAIYLVFAFFLLRYARKVERRPEASPVYAEDQLGKEEYMQANLAQLEEEGLHLRRAGIWSLVFLVLILFVLLSGPFLSAISAVALPLIGLLFFVGGIGAALLAGSSMRLVLKALRGGLFRHRPGRAADPDGCQHQVHRGHGRHHGHHPARRRPAFHRSQPVRRRAGHLLPGADHGVLHRLRLGQGLPDDAHPAADLADLVGVTRQTTVTAYCFGDGFSNLAYPTNPVLLISLGLTVVSFPKWLRWTLPLWGMVFVVTVIFLAIAVAIEFGPF